MVFRSQGGIVANDVNWICRVPQADHQWLYNLGELATMMPEGAHWAAVIHSGRGPAGFAAFIPGPAAVAAALPVLPLMPVAAPFVPLLPLAGAPPAGADGAGVIPGPAAPAVGGVPPRAGAGGALGVAAAGGLMDVGMGGGAAAAGAADGGLSMEALRRAAEDLRLMAANHKPNKNNKHND